MPDLPLNKTRAAAYKIENWIVQPSRNCIFRDGQEHKLEPKNIEVLLYLIEHQGSTVSKDELIQAVWPEVVVSEHSLNQSISKLRRVFGDDPRNPRIIETILKKGYRLIAAVERVEEKEDNYSSNDTDLLQADTNQQNKQRFEYINRTFLFLIAALMAVLLLIIAVIQLKIYETTNSAIKLTPLTSLPGVERFPVFSPDDKYLAFVHHNPAIRDADVLFCKNISTGANLKLTGSRGLKYFPRFSPDGARIAFVKFLDNECAIFTVPVNGGAETKFLDGFSAEIIGLDWSPDGEWMVYADQPTRSEAFAIFLVSLKDQRRIQLTAPVKKTFGDRLPVFSPDGKSVAFARRDAGWSEEIYILNIKSEELKQLTFENANFGGLDWSADSKKIIYLALKNKESRLAEVSVEDHSEKRMLSTIDYIGRNITVSNLSNKMAFEYGQVSSNLYKMPLDSEERKPEIFLPSTRSEWFAQHSPDGQKITFFSGRSGVPEIWVCDADGKNLRKLTDTALSFQSAPPRWSADGNRIVFDRKAEGKYETFIIDLKNESTELLASEAARPAFSRDGKWIYFNSRQTGDWQIWKMPCSGGEAIQVTHEGGFLGFESADGAEFFFCKADESGIWKLLPQNADTLIIDELDPQDKFNWTLVENGVYYLSRHQDNQPRLNFFDFATSKVTQLATIPAKYEKRIFGFSLAVDRKTILFSQIGQFEIDIMLVDGLR